ncbi:DUF2955 domain-containing protein [Shewanella algae]|uniref:DUF2955 domain-containing protein n=1 Tax=Shewanella algae TaxID=38313 RepID=UPI000C31C297|nr:DUF2955 domain-containing protein [Shewanella algae]MBO2640543.1 DUF2955 domain-containing protein [Shewanella algae]
MFHSATNSVIRLVFTPVLLLFYLIYSGAAIPVIAPVFVVILFTLMPSRPQLKVLLKLLVVLLFISFGIVTLGNLLIGTPTGFLLFTWSMMFLSYYRGHQDPKDIIANLTLVIVIFMVVMKQQMSIPLSALPWTLFESFIIAVLATYLGFWLFPGDETNIPPDETSIEGADKNMGKIVFKATATSIVLYALIWAGSSQALLIAITFGSMIKSPITKDSHTFGYHRLITTSVGILFTIPCMLLTSVNAPTFVIIGVTIFSGLQLACFAIRRKTHLTIYQLLFTNFIVLTYQIVNNPSVLSLSSQMVRLASIVAAISIGVLTINLLKSEPKNTH